MKIRILTLLLCLFTVAVNAQVTNSSVYSRFALGDVHLGAFTKQQGMAGLSYGIANPLFININNPASLAFTIQPTYTFGIKHEQVTASNTTDNQKNSYTQIDNFALSFPFAKTKGGIALGFIPFTTMGYQYTDSVNVDGVESPVKLNYDGKGGISNFFIKGGYRATVGRDTSIFKQHNYLSVGLGLKYYFGSVTKSKRVEFPVGEGFVNSFIADRTTYNDLGLDYGLFYRAYLMRKKNSSKESALILNVGMSYQPSFNLAGVKSKDVFSYTQNVSGEETPIDSISSARDQKGYAKLPNSKGMGFSLDYNFVPKNKDFQRNILFGVDYSMNNWSDFETNFFEINEFNEVTDNTNLIIGIQYRPNISFLKVDNYFQMCTYRMGYRSSTQFLTLNGRAITENGINLGISLPLVYGLKQKDSDSSLDISLGFGSRGTITDALIKEDYFRLMVGFSFHPIQKYDKWFRKSKYD